MSSVSDLLPSSVPREIKRTIAHRGVEWCPIFCANCGGDGGLVPEESVRDSKFAFYLCDPCAEKWTPLADTMLVPDEVFWAKVNDAQIEKYGRVLQPYEQIDELKNPASLLSKLARDRFAK